MKAPDTLGDVIRETREAQGMSQSELGRRMHDAGWPAWHQTTVSRTEKNSRPLRLDESLALVSVLGIPIESLTAAINGAPGPDATDGAIAARRAELAYLQATIAARLDELAPQPERARP